MISAGIVSGASQRSFEVTSRHNVDNQFLQKVRNHMLHEHQTWRVCTAFKADKIAEVFFKVKGHKGYQKS